jgi:O-antigen/teichoic acid export membrane protein
MDSSPEGSLRSSVGRAMSWKALSQVVGQVTSLVVLVILAHELGPHAYGLAGMVLVFSTLVFVFADVALGSALIQRSELDVADLDTVFWFSAATGLLFTGAALGLAGVVARFFGDPEVAPLIRAFSPTFFVTALSTVPYAVLARELDFKILELRKMGAALLAAVVAVAMAFSGAGAWAIIAQQLTFATASTVLVWGLGSWRPRLRLSGARLRRMSGFSLDVFGTRILFYVERNLDNTLVGRFLGPSALGIYALSYNLMLVPLERIGGPMAEVLFPAFARISGDLPRMRDAWLRAVRLLTAIVAPAMLLLIALAPDVVPVVMGSQWHAAVPVVQLLAWVGLHQSLQRFNSSVLQAVDKTRGLLVYAIVTVTVCTAGLVVGLQWEVTGVAAAYAISSTLVAPVYLVITTRSIQMPVSRFFGNVAGILGAAALAAGAAALARASLIGPVSSAPARLAIIVPPVVALYVLACHFLAPALAAEAAAMVPDRVRLQFARLRPARATL